MRNSEVGGSERNLTASSVYVCLCTMCAYEWSSFIELSVSIYDPLTCNKRHTVPPALRISSDGSEEKGKGV